MAKTWQCEQCGWKVTTGLRDGLSDGKPGECATCGNTTFDVLRVTGRLHRTIDGSDDGGGGQQTRRRTLQAIGGGIAVTGGSWWLFGRPTVSETSEVAMHDSQFHPRNVRVETGASVMWANEAESGEGEPISYFLRSATEGWDFQVEVPEGESTSYTFEQPGVYALYAEGIGDPDLSGMSMKIGVGRSIENPVGGWF